MSAKPMLEAHEVEAPPLLKVVEAAAASPQNDPHARETKRAKGSSLGSLRLTWLEQVTNDTGVTDAAFRIGHKIAEHINERELCAWPKLSTIASLLGRSERSVRDGVHTLTHRQHLECSKRGSGNLNQYELVLNNLTVEERDRAEAAAVAAVKAASSKRKAEAICPSQSQEPESAFDRFMEVFPTREGGHRVSVARSTYELNLQYDTTEDEMLAGVEAYAKFCDAHGYTGTRTVYDADEWLNIGGWNAVDPDEIPQSGKLV